MKKGLYVGYNAVLHTPTGDVPAVIVRTEYDDRTGLAFTLKSLTGEDLGTVGEVRVTVQRPPVSD